jgi:hypothetical protein
LELFWWCGIFLLYFGTILTCSICCFSFYSCPELLIKKFKCW